MTKHQEVLTPNIFLKKLKQVHTFLFITVVFFLLFSIWSMRLIFQVLTIPKDIVLIIVAIILTVSLIVEKIIFNIRLKRIRSHNLLKERILKYYKITADSYLIQSLIIVFSILIAFVINASIYLAFPIFLLIYYYKLRVVVWY